jgi:hypothetical protein
MFPNDRELPGVILPGPCHYSKAILPAGVSFLVWRGESRIENGTFVPLSSLRKRFTLAHVVSRGGSMELAIVIIALIVAGALIPDHSKIVFYR